MAAGEIDDQLAPLVAGLETSTVSLTLADMRRADAPLVGVNAAFCALTGYEREQVLGRNCRFLQPSGGAGPVRERIRAFLEDDRVEDANFVIPNVRADGKSFLNLVYLAKLRRAGRAELVLGSQFDLSGQSPDAIDLFETALAHDVRDIGKLAGERGLIVLGTMQSLASSHALITRARLERAERAALDRSRTIAAEEDS